MERDDLLGGLAVQIGLASSEDIDRLRGDPRGLARAVVEEQVISVRQREIIESFLDEMAAPLSRETLYPDSLEGEPHAVSIRPERITPEAAGRYRQEPTGELGRGGIGRVLVAYDEHLCREVAIKELLKGTPRAMPTRSARFLREARVTGQLEHPNIVPVYELGRRADGTLYYTMKVVRGHTLEDALTDCDDLRARLRLLPNYVGLCQALAYAHSRGVVHRDVKPANVMLGSFGETVVLDWGLARVKGTEDLRGEEMLAQVRDDSDSHTVDGQMLGTPRYMSPEQAEGRLEDVDARSDVWSLGVVLYEILVGKQAFRGRNLYAVRSKVVNGLFRPVQSACPEAPAELAAICQRAMQVDPDERYPTAGALAEDIEAWLTGDRVHAYEYGTLEILSRYARRHRAVLSAIGIAVGVVFVLGVLTEIEVRTERRVALDNLATAQLEGAEAAFQRGALREARAKLRESLELRDSLPARALWGRLQRSHLLWSDRIARRILDLAWFHDGSTLAVGCSSFEVLLLDGHTGLARSLSTGDRAMAWLALSDDDQLLAAAGTDGAVRLWDLGTGQATELAGLEADAGGLTFDGDGRLWAADIEGRLRAWRGGELVASHDLEVGVGALEASPARGLAVGLADGGVGLLDPDSGALALLGRHDAAVADLDFTADGTRLASAGRDHRVGLWDLSLHERRWLEGHGAPVTEVAFSPGGQILASGGEDDVMRLWELGGTSAELTGATHLGEHSGGIRGLTWRPDGGALATGDVDGRLVVWNTARTSLPERGHPDMVGRIARSRDGAFLLTGGNDPVARLWSTATGEQLDELPEHGSSLSAVALSADGHLGATAGWDGTIRVWDLRAGVVERVLQLTEDVWAVAFDPSARWLAGGDDAGVVRIWDLETGGKVSEMHAGSRVMGLAFTEEGLVGAAGDSAMIWALPSGELRHRWTHSARLRWMDVDPTGSRVALGGRDGSVLLWSLDEEEAQVLGVEPHQARAVAFSPDGRRLATSAASVRVRDLGDGSLQALPSEVYGFALAWDPAGEVLFTSFTQLEAWEVETGRRAWRAPVLLDTRLLTHLGWVAPGGGPLAPPPAARWLEAAAESLYTARAPRTACVLVDENTVELWDVTEDRLLGRSERPTSIGRIDDNHLAWRPARAVHALPGACLTVSEGEVLLHRADGDQVISTAGPGAIGTDGEQIAVLTESSLVRLSVEGEELGRRVAGEDDAVVLRVPGASLVATASADLRLVEDAGGELVLAAVEGLEPTAAVAGPAGTVAIGWMNGTVGLWDRATGALLDSARLHGAVQHLELQGERLHAATEVGDHLAWDVALLDRPRCEVLAEVQEKVPYVWEDGGLVLNPEGSPCR